MICDNKDLWNTWKFNLGNHQGYLKSNDIINLGILKRRNSLSDNGHYEFLRSHDIQFTIGNDTFQEVVCHNERLGGNDEVILFDFIFIEICMNINIFFSF